MEAPEPIPILQTTVGLIAVCCLLLTPILAIGAVYSVVSWGHVLLSLSMWVGGAALYKRQA